MKVVKGKTMHMAEDPAHSFESNNRHESIWSERTPVVLIAYINVDERRPDGRRAYLVAIDERPRPLNLIIEELRSHFSGYALSLHTESEYLGWKCFDMGDDTKRFEERSSSNMQNDSKARVMLKRLQIKRKGICQNCKKPFLAKGKKGVTRFIRSRSNGGLLTFFKLVNIHAKCHTQVI